MQKQKQLNLLIIDDNQLYAEHLVGLLEKHYYRQVNLGFLDAKDELIKLLRQSWDIILMGNAYDLSFKDVKEILKAHDAHIPVIALLPDDATDYPEVLTANEQAQTQLVATLIKPISYYLYIPIGGQRMLCAKISYCAWPFVSAVNTSIIN